jgi:hypothetical protein
VRIALLTEGGYPYARGEGGAWCDRLVRGLAHHEFDVYALSRSPRTEAGGRVELPSQVRRFRTERLWGEPPAAALAPTCGGGRAVRKARRNAFLTHYRDFAEALAGAGGGVGGSGAADRADRFASGLYGLAEVAAEYGGLPDLLRGEDALNALEAACRAPGVRPVLGDIVVTELLAVAGLLEVQLRPLSAPWYGPSATPCPAAPRRCPACWPNGSAERRSSSPNTPCGSAKRCSGTARPG